MTYLEIKTLIASIGLPFAYYQFTETTVSPPFICYFFTGSDDLVADNTNYQRIRPLAIELYTRTKDFELEQEVEDALNGAGLVYTRDETPLDTERMHMVIYTTSVCITDEIDITEVSTNE